MEAVVPQVVFYIFGLPITDTVISTWVMMAMIIAGALLVRKYQPSVGEFIIEFINDIVSSVMPEGAQLLPHEQAQGFLRFAGFV